MCSAHWTKSDANSLQGRKLPSIFRPCKLFASDWVQCVWVADTLYLVCERFLAKQMLYMLSQIEASKLNSYIAYGIVIGSFSSLILKWPIRCWCLHLIFEWYFAHCKLFASDWVQCVCLIHSTSIVAEGYIGFSSHFWFVSSSITCSLAVLNAEWVARRI